MKKEKKEEGKRLTDLFGIKGKQEKQSKDIKINYPDHSNEDLYYEVDTYEADNETGLFI